MTLRGAIEASAQAIEALETEGRWPWQQRHDAGVARHGAPDRLTSDDRPAERAA